MEASYPLDAAAETAKGGITMDVREKLEVIAHLGDHITCKDEYGICYDSALAKVIEDAYMTLKNGVTVQEWISVKDMLPELHTKVLCCGIKGGRFIAELSTWGKEKHLCWDKRNGQGCPTVTHWMPLPQPPKGE